MLHIVEALDSSELVLSPTRSPTRSAATSARSFRPFGEVRDQLKFYPTSSYLLVRTIDLVCSLALYQRMPMTLFHL